VGYTETKSAPLRSSLDFIKFLIRKNSGPMFRRFFGIHSLKGRSIPLPGKDRTDRDKKAIYFLYSAEGDVGVLKKRQNTFTYWILYSCTALKGTSLEPFTFP